MKPHFFLLILTAAVVRADVVTNTADSGPGSLRQVFEDHLRGGTGITFSPELSGQTINLGSELYIGESFTVHPITTLTVSIDAGNVPGGVTIRRTGGNIFSAPTGTSLTLRNLTLSGGAIRSLSSLELTGCTFTGSSGTAVMNEMGTATITRCTFFGNGGVGVSNPYTGGMTLNHCTVTGYAIGLSNGYRYSSMSVANCIIAGNTSTDVSNSHTFTRAGANIIQTFSSTHPDNGNPISEPYPSRDFGPPAITAAPQLAPLGNYGGPTMTMALLPGSPARDAAAGSSSASDQRGFPVAGTPDIGAYEAGNAVNYNAWATETFPATAGAAERAAAFDFDGDGQTNGDEFNFLTDPLSAANFFVPLVAVQGGSVIISFASASGRTYTLQQNNTLAPAAWNNAPGLPVISGDGTVKSFTVPATASREFFRVLGVP